MRHFLLYTVAISSISVNCYAQSVDYNDPGNHQDRMVPSQQYSNGSRQMQVKGQVARKSDVGYLNSPDYELNASLEGGYRNSELEWNIAGDLNGTSPNILSELYWETSGYEVQPSIEYTQKTGPLKGLNVQASMNKSVTISGENQDSDYAGNNRSFEFSRSNNSSDSGDSLGFSASIGYAFNFNKSRSQNLMRFTILAGYAIQKQTFDMTDGFQTINFDPNNSFAPGYVGPFDGLNSSYDMELSMPFIGIEYLARVNKHNFKLRGTASKGSYDGTGHWNLRSDFAQPDSFKQEADGYGVQLGIKYGYNIYKNTQLTLSNNVNYFRAEDGLDTTYFSDGTTGQTKFNEAQFLSYNVLAGLNYTF